MKYIIASVMLVSALIFFSCSNKPQYEHAVLHIEPEKADFGKIAADDPIAYHDVSLKAKNLGKEALNIEDIELPEGFSYVMVPSRQVIEGGEEATLKITMDVRKFSGPVSETAYFVSDASDRPRVPIELTAEVLNKAIDSDTASDMPDISLDHNAVDFGAIGRSQMVEHTFPFKNIGRKPLKILGLETMCLCVTAWTTMKEIPPGGSAAIVARLEAYNYEGNRPWKTLVISTNDPDEPVVHISVAAHIVDEAILEPESVLLTNIQSGRPASAEVKLIRGGAQDLVIKKMETSSPKITVTSSPLEGDQLGYLLKVAISPDMPVGKFDEIVTIFTNYRNYARKDNSADEVPKIYKDYSRLKLAVKGSVIGAISVAPQKVNFGSCTPGRPVKRKLIVSTTESDFDIESVSLQDQGFRVSHSPVEAGRKYEITVEFIPDGPERQITDELVISAGGSELVVPILAAVRSSSN